MIKECKMRRKDKEISDRKWIDRIIENSQVCRIAASKDNIPYIIPVSFGYDGESIYFHTAKEGKKIDYFYTNNIVCFEFEGKVDLIPDKEKACNWTFDYESVIGFGRIEELLSGKEKKYGLNRVMLQYTGKEWDYTESELNRVKLWKIVIDSISGKYSESKSSA